jgi:hypothetical protein
MLRSPIKEILCNLDSHVKAAQRLGEEEGMATYSLVLESLYLDIKLTLKGKISSEVELPMVPAEPEKNESQEKGWGNIFLRLFGSGKSLPNKAEEPAKIPASPPLSPPEKITPFSDMFAKNEDKKKDSKKKTDPHCINDEMMLLLIRACSCVHRTYEYLKELNNLLGGREEDEDEEEVAAFISNSQLIKEVKETVAAAKQKFVKQAMRFYCMVPGPGNSRIMFEKYYTDRFCMLPETIKKKIVVGVITLSDRDRLFMEHRIDAKADFTYGLGVS